MIERGTLTKLNEAMVVPRDKKKRGKAVVPFDIGYDG